MSATPHLGCTCCHLMNHRLLMLHPNEHVENLGLLQESIKPLHAICTTWTTDLRPKTLIGVATTTPYGSWETDLNDCGTVFNQLLRCHVSLDSFCLVLCCCDEPPTAPPQKRARVNCGCPEGPTRVMPPSRKDDGSIRAPAFCLLVVRGKKVACGASGC